MEPQTIKESIIGLCKMITGQTPTHTDIGFHDKQTLIESLDTLIHSAKHRYTEAYGKLYQDHFGDEVLPRCPFVVPKSLDIDCIDRAVLVNVKTDIFGDMYVRFKIDNSSLDLPDDYVVYPITMFTDPEEQAKKAFDYAYKRCVMSLKGSIRELEQTVKDQKLALEFYKRHETCNQ